MKRTMNTTTGTRRRGAAVATAVAVGFAGLLGTAAPATAAPSVPAVTGVAAVDEEPGFPTRKLERLLDEMVAAGAVGVTAEVRLGDQVWSSSRGKASLDPSRKASPDARFRAASVTKQLISVLALQQVEKGRWTLDTTIGEAAPGVWPGREAITLRQLLSHTSGMPDFLTPAVSQAFTNEAFLDVIGKRWTDQEIIGYARGLPWAGEPGAGYTYSNTGYVVVGEMLRRATGLPVQALVKRDILKPAGMQDSFFATDRRLPGPKLAEYARGFPGGILDLKRFNPSMFSSAGALVSTAADLNDFHVALESGELIEKRTVRTMQREVLGGSGYGLGSYELASPCADGPAINGHDGGSWGTFTVSFAAGEDRQVTVAMTGRSYRLDQYAEQGKALAKAALGGFEATCEAGATGTTTTEPRLIDLENQARAAR